MKVTVGAIPLDLWSIPKKGDRVGPSARKASLRHVEAVKAVYSGVSDPDGDYHRMGRSIAKDAHEGKRWLACGCREVDGRRPVLCPVYLPGIGLYYLKRMVQSKRLEHDPECVFYRERVPSMLTLVPTYPAIVKPDGDFAVAAYVSDQRLASGPEGVSSVGAVSARSVPKMQRLLFELIDQAGLNWIGRDTVAGPNDGRGRNGGVPRIVDAIDEDVMVCEGVRLRDVLVWSASKFPDGLIERIKRQRYPEGRARQGFGLLYVRDVRDKSLMLADENKQIDVIGMLSRPSGGRGGSAGPYLGLVVVAPDVSRPDKGFEAMRGHAHLVFSSQVLCPVDNSFERAVLAALIRVAEVWNESQSGFRTKIHKPLWDIVTVEGSCRPSFELVWEDLASGGEQSIFFDVTGLFGEAEEQARAERRSNLWGLGPVVEVPYKSGPRLLSDPLALGRTGREALAQWQVRRRGRAMDGGRAAGSNG